MNCTCPMISSKLFAQQQKNKTEKNALCISFLQKKIFEGKTISLIICKDYFLTLKKYNL